MEVDAFTSLADFYALHIPERFLLDRQGDPIPIIVEEIPKRRRGDPPGVYILGEYITTEYLPPQIRIYYGSFAKLFRDEPQAVWEDELWDTLLHEIRHHLEGAAGVHDLEQEDFRELQEMWQQEEARRRLRERGP